MASIACQGGPMKMSPDSVHLRANAEFSLNYIRINTPKQLTSPRKTYEPVARMNTNAASPLRSLNDFISIEVRGRIAQVDRERRTQSMLRSSIRIRIDRCSFQSILGRGFSHAPICQ